MSSLIVFVIGVAVGALVGPVGDIVRALAERIKRQF